MALLYGYWDKPCNPKIRRSFQANGWGNAEGQICIAELRGLPAYSNRERVDQTAYLPERILFLKNKIKEHPPEFVVFYGKEDEEYWNQIANVNKGLILDGITGRGNTLFGYMPHPVAFKPFKRSHDHWKRIGEQLCQEQKNLKSRLI